MPIFSSPDQLKDHKAYVPLLKKALLNVKPDAEKKFLYYKQFPFGAKKLPLVVVDFDVNFQNALNKAGHKTSAEGMVALTSKDELNFEPKKGDLKRAGIQKYFSTMGGGIKPVYVPVGETDDEETTETSEGDSSGSISAGPFPINLDALKWKAWFRAKPRWPEVLTKASWDKNKSVLAKMTLSTGVGEQLKACEAAYQAAVAKMPVFSRANQQACQAYINDATVKALHESLKSLKDIATKAAVEAQKSTFVPKSTAQLCNNISGAADALLVSCNPNTLGGCLVETIKAAGPPWPVDKLKAEPDLQKRIALSEKMLELKSGTASERDQVEEILALAKKEWGVSQAKAAYAAQMNEIDHQGDANTPAYNPGKQFNPKNLQEREKIFDDKKVQQLMKDTGLTEGEVLAIRAYTAENYKFINPAIANQKDRTDKGGKDWMNQNAPDPSQAGSEKGKKLLQEDLKKFNEGSAKDGGTKMNMYEEGALHAGMMVEAFKKLPKKSGTLYRGTRMIPEDFAKTYSKGKEVAYEAFASQSTSKEVARGFANGTSGNIRAPDDATTSVFIEAQITDARDVQALSVYGDKEKEWLLPPGTKLRVVDVQEDSQRDAGLPPAKQWKKVIMKQV